MNLITGFEAAVCTNFSLHFEKTIE